MFTILIINNMNSTISITQITIPISKFPRPIPSKKELFILLYLSVSFVGYYFTNYLDSKSISFSKSS